MNNRWIFGLVALSLLPLACSDSVTGPEGDLRRAHSSGVAAVTASEAGGENIALNLSRTGYPHPLESTVGYGSVENLWYMVDEIISPGRSSQEEGIALNTQLEWQDLTIAFGGTRAFHQVKVWGEYADFWERTEDKRVEYWDGERWIEIGDGSWSLEWRWLRDEDVHVSTSSTDWSPVFTDEYNLGRSASIFTFDEVRGSKVRVRCRPQEWFWLWEIEVYGFERLLVDIDIRPGSYWNLVYPEGRGWIPVAVLSAGEFDATDVDPATVTLGDDDGHDTPVAGWRGGRLMAATWDVDWDGDRDLVVAFETRALAHNGALGRHTRELVLKGETVDGMAIWGSDRVYIVPRFRRWR